MALLTAFLMLPLGCRFFDPNRNESDQSGILGLAQTPMVGTTQAVSFRIILPNPTTNNTINADRSCTSFTPDVSPRLGSFPTKFTGVDESAMDDSNPSIVARKSLSDLASTGQSENILLRGIVLDSAKEARPLLESANITPAINLASTTPPASPSVTVKLILIDLSKPESPITTLTKKIPVDSSGTARGSFGGVPAVTVIGDILIEGGHIGSWTAFHGACDLRENASNTINLGPKESKGHEDILAQAILLLISDPATVIRCSPGLAARLGAAIEGLDLTQADIYQRALTRYLTFTESMACLETSLKNILSTKVVTANGGSVEVASSTSPVKGLVVTVPPGAFSAPVEVKIESSEISTHSLGVGVELAAPLIAITTAGQEADIPISVKIPVTLGIDEFPMAFNFDSRTGRMEALPVVDAGGDSITVAAKSFSNSFLSPSIRNEMSASPDSSGILVLRKKVGDLDSLNISTEFVPGRDDCQCPNWGSILEPRGIGPGLTLGVLWYFTERKTRRGEPAFFGLYDNDGSFIEGGAVRKTPALWQDDSLIIRFASLIQRTAWAGVGSWVKKNLLESTTGGTTDTRTFRACKFALEQTKRPQYLLVGGKNASGTDVSQALIVYKADANTLFVSDPNWPGQEKTISFAGGAFGAFTSGENRAEIASGRNINFTDIRFLGEEALINQATIENLWQGFRNRTIGRGSFPSMTWEVLSDSGSWSSMSDTFTTASSGFSFAWKSEPTYTESVTSVYTSNGTAIRPRQSIISGQTVQTISISTGTNELGLYVMLKDSGTGTFQWGDFKRITVNTSFVPPVPPEEKAIRENCASMTAILENNSLSSVDRVRTYMEFFNPDFLNLSGKSSYQDLSSYTATLLDRYTINNYRFIPKSFAFTASNSIKVTTSMYLNITRLPGASGGVSAAEIYASPDPEITWKFNGTSWQIIQGMPYTWSEWENSITTDPATDITPPNVVGVSPSENAVDVGTNSRIVVDFSEVVASSTITGTTVTVASGGTSIAGEFGFSSDGLTMFFYPQASLPFGSKITVTVTTGVKDLAGNAMTSDKVWTFTTLTTLTPKTLSGISLNPASASVNASETYRLTNITVTASYNNATDAVVTDVIWFGTGVSEATFTAPNSSGSYILTCNYSEGGVTKTASFTATVQGVVPFSASATILLSIAGVVADSSESGVATPTMTARLILVNVGNATNPTTILTKTVYVTENGDAKTEFVNIPTLPVVGEVHFVGGKVGGFTDFHGGTDLLLGTNSINLSPNGCKLIDDVIAEVMTRIVADPTIFAKASTDLAARLVTLASGLDLASPTIYDDLLSAFASQ